MDIAQAKQELRRTIRAYTAKTEDGVYRMPRKMQRPVLLMGPPGIGKTAILSQLAQEEHVGLAAYTMTHHTRQSALGLPVIVGRTAAGKTFRATEYTMSEIIASVYEQMEKTGLREGILFLDEINCVSETLMPAILQMLQNKTFGVHALPEGWMIAAAGNPPRYNQSARSFDMATLDRVRRIDLEPSLAVWQDYAAAHGVHPAVLAYLRLHPEHFFICDAQRAAGSFVTARGWEDLSTLLSSYERLGFPCIPNATESRHDIIQAVELGSAERMLAFCRGIQAAAPVDSYVTPVPWAMPGYDAEVVMAAGAFVQGSSIELSADGPIRPPYAIYFQGGLTWYHAKLGILMSVQKLVEAGLAQLPAC